MKIEDEEVFFFWGGEKNMDQVFRSDLRASDSVSKTPTGKRRNQQPVYLSFCTVVKRFDSDRGRDFLRDYSVIYRLQETNPWEFRRSTLSSA